MEVNIDESSVTGGSSTVPGGGLGRVTLDENKWLVLLGILNI